MRIVNFKYFPLIVKMEENDMHFSSLDDLLFPEKKNRTKIRYRPFIDMVQGWKFLSERAKPFR